MWQFISFVKKKNEVQLYKYNICNFRGILCRLSATELRKQRPHLQLIEIRPPGAVHELQPVVFGEVSQVRDEGGGEEDVSTQGPLLLSKVLHCLCPADVLGGQSPHLKRRRIQTNTTITSAPSWPPIKWNLNKHTACPQRRLGPSGNLQDNNDHCLQVHFSFIRFSYLLSPLCWCTNTSTLYWSNDPISL